MNASTLQYDRRDAERTLIEMDNLMVERDSLEVLYFYAENDGERDRIGLALDACGDAIGVLQARLHETEYEIGLF